MPASRYSLPVVFDNIGGHSDFVSGGGATDNLAAWNQAMYDLGRRAAEITDVDQYGGVTLQLGKGDYWFSDTPELSRGVILEGMGSHDLYGNTRIFVAAGSCGLKTRNVYTSLQNPFGSAANSVIRGISFFHLPPAGTYSPAAVAGQPFPVFIIGETIVTGDIRRSPALEAGPLGADYGWAWIALSGGTVTSIPTISGNPRTNNLNGSAVADKRVVPAASTDVVTCTESDGTTPLAHGLDDGDQIIIYTDDGVLATGVPSGTVVYVRDSDATSFKIALTSGGAAVDLTSDGSGTQKFQPVSYTERADVTDGTIVWRPVQAHGLDVQTKCRWEDVTFRGFPGHGINVNGNVQYTVRTSDVDQRYTGDNLTSGTAFACIGNGGHGLFVAGGDAGACHFKGGDYRDNRGYGFQDHGGSENKHETFHCALNQAGPWESPVAVVEVGYNEGGYGTPVATIGAKLSRGTYAAVNSGGPETSRVAGLYTAPIQTRSNGLAVVDQQLIKFPGSEFVVKVTGSGNLGGSQPTPTPDRMVDIWNPSATELTDGDVTLQPVCVDVDPADVGQVDLGRDLHTSQTFVNRHGTDYAFTPGGTTEGEVASFHGPSDEDSGNAWGLVRRAAAWAWNRAGLGSGDAITLRDDNTAGAPNGLYIADVFVGSGTAAPTGDSYPNGSIVINTAATTGNPSYWQKDNSGTWQAHNL